MTLHHRHHSEQFSFTACLLRLYPPLLLLLAFFPVLTGFFIDYELVDTRQIAILLIWIPALTIPYLLSGKRIFYFLITLLCFINGFVNLGFWVLIKGPVSASGLFVLFNTNIQEAFGFAQLKSSAEYLLFIPYLCLFFLALRYPPKKRHFKGTGKYYLSGVAGLISLCFIAENTIHKRFIRKGTPVLVEATLAFNKELKAFKQPLWTNKKVVAQAPAAFQKQVIVLIMGESTNRNHMSLYGYYRPTNPLLARFDSLIIYTNVISSCSHTIESVPTSLSQADLENELQVPKSITLADVFNVAGYKTYWLSNQSPIGVWDNIITLFSRQYKEREFVNTSGNSSRETLDRRSYDSKLFMPFRKALSENYDKKLIVLHLMGAHSSYKKRFPSAFRRFKNNKDEQSKTIAAYDNAILFNDFVVDSLLNFLKNYCSKTQTAGASVYVSDHGENVYDFGDYAGHDYTKTIPNCLVEIPFLVWLSPKYIQIFPKKSQTIRRHRHLPFETDDLFYALIDISGIKTPVFLPSKSIFNLQFDSLRARKLVNGQHYNN